MANCEFCGKQMKPDYDGGMSMLDVLGRIMLVANLNGHLWRLVGREGVNPDAYDLSDISVVGEQV